MIRRSSRPCPCHRARSVGRCEVPEVCKPPARGADDGEGPRLAETTRAMPDRHDAEEHAMELCWLEDFKALVECMNFSRAAERRNVTQPAFSRRVRALERWIGTPLFDRGTHRLGLTPAGAKFRQVAEATLRRLSPSRKGTHIGRAWLRGR